jgi:hypothetical protein
MVVREKRTATADGSEFGCAHLQTDVKFRFRLLGRNLTIPPIRRPDASIMRAALDGEQADRRSWASMRGLFEEVFRWRLRRAARTLL